MRRLKKVLLWPLLPLLAAAGCVGGQTTTPSSGPPVPCTPLDAGAVDAEYLGVHTLEVHWEQTKIGEAPSAGTTELTVEIAMPSDPSSCAPTLAIFDVSSADGVITASGTAKVIATDPLLELELVDVPLVRRGGFVFGDALELTLLYFDGSTIDVRGTLP